MQKSKTFLNCGQYSLKLEIGNTRLWDKYEGGSKSGKQSAKEIQTVLTFVRIEGESRKLGYFHLTTLCVHQMPIIKTALSWTIIPFFLSSSGILICFALFALFQISRLQQLLHAISFFISFAKNVRELNKILEVLNSYAQCGVRASGDEDFENIEEHNQFSTVEEEFVFQRTYYDF
ncbi:hypothetical protein EGR_09819 [Echinococcus granulosus]|uniref:Uncharacterized protein n=1 Tax=Echinococcus granulosus TaxID=6210 RepID=W6UPI9_ECHGR|nr:hypothetical protein EGR_09819 [Echinococcus granulosus]EUB55324.1 hypothetical protein EGR_09819 [Echinococcus granulosus]